MNLEFFQEEALVIARDLRSHSRRTSGGEPCWGGPTGYGTDLIPLRLVQLGPHLYDGTTGIALFLASLDRVIGDEPSRTLCLETIAPLRRKLNELAADPSRASLIRFPIGGLIGVGSWIYALLRIGLLLEIPELLDEALQATCLITSDRIARDDRVRVQTGCAGTILALLALHRHKPQPNAFGKRPLELAMECAGRLLEARTSFASGPKAWVLSSGKPPLAGFSYGAAGICYALLRLHAVCAESKLLAAAEEGQEFIRSFYSPEQGSWRDPRVEFEAFYTPRRGTWKDWWASGTLEDLEFREPRDKRDSPEEFFPEMWCHGSTGIALARVAALDREDSPAIREEISRVLSSLKHKVSSPECLAEGPDDLCCGHMGRVELLLTSARELEDEEAGAAAGRLMSLVVGRAKKEGMYRLSAARGSTLFAPSLFQGISGIGYTLLRLTAPNDLPRILLLE